MRVRYAVWCGCEQMKCVINDDDGNDDDVYVSVYVSDCERERVCVCVRVCDGVSFCDGVCL